MDLTFITSTLPFLASIVDNIIAMSWPGSFFDSMWRNNIHDVEGFLNRNYKGNYWVYPLSKDGFYSRINLCAESSYSSSTIPPFGNRFTHYSIRDHNACSLSSQVPFLPSFNRPNQNHRRAMSRAIQSKPAQCRGHSLQGHLSLMESRAGREGSHRNDRQLSAAEDVGLRDGSRRIAVLCTATNHQEDRILDQRAACVESLADSLRVLLSPSSRKRNPLLATALSQSHCCACTCREGV